MGFAEDLSRLCEKAGDAAEQVVRKVTIDMAASMVQRSPVDTGRFKSNWQIGVGSINTATSAPPDTSGGSALGRISAGIAGAPMGQTLWVTNSLPYAARIESGWSKQAPAGVVATTVAEFGDFFRKALGDAK